MSHFYSIIEVTKSYVVGAVTVEALRGVTIRLERGEFVALQGPSGSGKSTLLNVLGMLERPTSGEIEFNQKKIHSLRESELTLLRQRYIGFIFQNFNLIPILSAVENVEYPLYLEQRFSRSEIRKQAMEMLDGVGLGRFASHKPRELSGGQRQRVAIARALVKTPELVLADEPTANLDSKTAAQILSLIKELQSQSGTTVLVATHDDTIAKAAGRLIGISDGLVDRDGTLSDLSAAKNAGKQRS